LADTAPLPTPFLGQVPARSPQDLVRGEVIAIEDLDAKLQAPNGNASSTMDLVLPSTVDPTTPYLVLDVRGPDRAPRDDAGHTSWIDAGALEIPNPGLEPHYEGGFLLMPLSDDMGLVAFRAVENDEELRAVADQYPKEIHAKDARFGKATLALLDPEGILADVGTGHLVGQDGREGNVVFGVLEAKPRVFFLAATHDDAPPEDLALAEAIVFHVRTK